MDKVEQVDRDHREAVGQNEKNIHDSAMRYWKDRCFDFEIQNTELTNKYNTENSLRRMAQGKVKELQIIIDNQCKQYEYLSELKEKEITELSEKDKKEYWEEWAKHRRDRIIELETALEYERLAHQSQREATLGLEGQLGAMRRKLELTEKTLEEERDLGDTRAEFKKFLKLVAKVVGPENFRNLTEDVLKG